MRLLISFFLSVFVYILIIVFFAFFLLKKDEQKKEVLIHTAIIPQIQKKSLKVQKKVKKVEKKIKKKVKQGSKSNVEKGGDVSFEDIFKNVKASVPTTPVKLKKSNMSRYKGIEKTLNKVKLLNVDISYKNNSKNDNVNVNEIIKKISEIWNLISDVPGEYAKIKVINRNGNIDVIVLDANINTRQQHRLINEIRRLNFNKDFDLDILFQTKVSK